METRKKRKTVLFLFCLLNGTCDAYQVNVVPVKIANYAIVYTDTQ